MKTMMRWLLAWQLLAPSLTAAQAVHLPPPLRPPVGRTDTLLSFTVASATAAQGALRLGSTLRVTNQAIVITPTTGVAEYVELGNRTLGDLVDYLRSHFQPGSGVEVTTPYRELSTRFLADTALTLTAGAHSIRANPTRATRYVSLGVLYTLNQGGDANQGSALLSQGGFHLDLAGDTPTKRVWKIGLVGRARASLASSDAIPVESQQVNADQDASPLSSFITTTEQVTLAAEVHALLGDSPFAISGEVASSWSTLDAFVFPDEVTFSSSINDVPVQGGGTPQAFTDLFDQGDIDAARGDLDRILPLFSWTLNATARFPPTGSYSFYAGLGIGQREIVSRDLVYRFRREPDPADPDAEIYALSGLRGSLTTPTVNIWRAMFGVSFGELLELRADAVSPRGDRDNDPSLQAFDPIFRLSVTKPFRLGN